MIHFKKIRWKNFLSTGNAFTEVQLDRSKSTLIIGDNGAGKSTLLNAMAGLTTVHQGGVEGSIEGLCPNAVAYLPQQTQLDKSFPINVFELVVTGIWAELGFSKSVTRKQYDQCADAIAEVS